MVFADETPWPLLGKGAETAKWYAWTIATPKGLAFAIAVAVSKYADHLPLERQVKIMRREGLVVDSQTLYDQIEALARVAPTSDESSRSGRGLDALAALATVLWRTCFLRTNSRATTSISSVSSA